MKKINLKKYFSYKNAIFLSLLFVAIFLFGGLAFASDWVNNVVGGIIGVFISGVTKILILLVNVLIVVASYSDFIHADAVTKGWVVVRDVCNMFFVVILLVIAFATILGQEEYSAKKNLPKLIMAAVLINFSKLFCGLMIDVASVVMLTFVNAFKEIGSGNIIDMLGISDVLKYGQGATPPSLSSTVAAYIFGLIYVLIATVVVASMLAMLVMRIVMIWIYVVLSPAAFFLQAVPGKGQQYASQWWSKWSSNLIVGPVLAFFLWLSFAALQSGNPLPSVSDAQNQSEAGVYAATNKGTSTESIDSKAGSVDGFAKFAIAIGMLLGGMKIAQEVGGETGSVLGKGMSAINKGKTMAIGAATGAAIGASKWVGRGARNTSLSVAGGLANRFSEKDEITGKRKGNAVGNLAVQWRDDMKSARKKTKDANREKFLKKIGMGEKSAEIGKSYLSGGIIKTKLGDAEVQSIGRGSKNILTGAAIGSVLGPIGAAIGGAVGLTAGLISKNKYNGAKKDKESYEAAGKSTDETKISSITNKKDKSTWSNDQKEAVERMQGYNKNKKIVENRDNNPAFNHTISAMKNMTTKKKNAEDWVKVTAKNPDYLQKVGRGGIYDVNGINDVWKRRLDELNKGGGGVDGADGAVDTLEAQINTLGASGARKDDAKLEEFAKLIAAYEKGGATVNSGTLGRLKSALAANRFDPSNPAIKDQVLTNYKGLTSNMKVEAGSGNLQYDAFAKNSAKDPVDRKSEKDIMGVSFAKFNAKAKSMGADGLSEAAGVNQKMDGNRLKKLSGVMSSLIDDEITALSAVGDDASKNKITQLNAAKGRLASGDLSGLSLKNTDVKYDGATDSERRRNEYNTVQHETMHQAGAKDEELVDDSSNALQESKLVGNIPGSSGQRYDQEIGKLIATMEQTNVSQDDIRAAVASQIDKWQPASNAQRIIETEKGERETLRDIVPPAEISTEGIEKAISKLSSSLDKTTLTSPSGKVIQLTPTDKDFFRNLFRKANKISSAVVEKLKPLGVMAAAEEKRRNP